MSKGLSVTVDIKDLHIFKDMLEITAYLFRHVSPEHQEHVVKMMNDKEIMGMVIKEDGGFGR